MNIDAWTSMLSGLLLLCAGFTAVSSAEPNKTVIFQPFNSNLSLICNHGYDLSVATIVRWGWDYIEVGDYFNQGTLLWVDASNKRTGTAIDNNTLVSFDHESGNIVFKEIHCYENRLFLCKMLGPNFLSLEAKRDVYLGRPDYPRVTISSGVNSVRLSNSTECKPFTVTTDTVTVESSVSSRPKVNISINGQAINLACNPYGLCADSGQVQCVMMETLRVTMEQELHVVITYMGRTDEGSQQLLSWNYCVYFDFVTTTTTQAPSTVAKITTTITRSTPDAEAEKNGEDEQEDGDDEDLEKERSTSRAVILKITTTCIICSVMIAIDLYL